MQPLVQLEREIESALKPYSLPARRDQLSGSASKGLQMRRLTSVAAIHGR